MLPFWTDTKAASEMRLQDPSSICCADFRTAVHHQLLSNFRKCTVHFVWPKLQDTHSIGEQQMCRVHSKQLKKHCNHFLGIFHLGAAMRTLQLLIRTAADSAYVIDPFCPCACECGFCICCSMHAHCFLTSCTQGGLVPRPRHRIFELT